MSQPLVLSSFLRVCSAVAFGSFCFLSFGCVFESILFLVLLERMPLLPYSFAAQRAENLTAEADEHVDRYIEQASTAVLKSCGLFDRLKRLNEAESGVPLAKVPGMDIEGLSISLKNFYAMLLGRLPTVDVDYLTPPKVCRSHPHRDTRSLQKREGKARRKLKH